MIEHPDNPNILGFEGLVFDDDFTVARYSSVGCYPIYYLAGYSGVLCGGCVEVNLDECADLSEEADPQWSVVAHDVNWEDQHLFCDHCNKRIESAYGEE